MSSNDPAAPDLGFPHRFVPGEDGDAPVILLLHGTGGDEHDLLPLGKQLSPSSPLLSPRGKVRENGMPRWFRRLAEGVFDEQDLVHRADELARFVNAAVEHHRVGDRDVIAAGFSNGANIAAALLLLRPKVLRGAVLFSAMLPLHPSKLPDLAHVAVYMGQGRHDPLAPPPQAEQLARLLTEAGATVTLDWHDGGHSLSPAEVERARTWLTKLTAATAADPGALP